jgi:hypothetical protein
MNAHRVPLVDAAAVLLGVGFLGRTADAHAVDGETPTHEVPANVNDPAIDTSRGEHLVWLGPAQRRVGKLLLFLPSGGLNNVPTDWEWMGTERRRLGYHTLVLAYRNEVPVAAAPPNGCGNTPDPPASAPDCACDPDVAAPVLRLPGSLAVDAHARSGAVVDFTVTASDDWDPQRRREGGPARGRGPHQARDRVWLGPRPATERRSR